MRNDYDHPNVCMGDSTAALRSLPDQSHYLVALVYNIGFPQTHPFRSHSALGR